MKNKNRSILRSFFNNKTPVKIIILNIAPMKLLISVSIITYNWTIKIKIIGNRFFLFNVNKDFELLNKIIVVKAEMSNIYIVVPHKNQAYIDWRNTNNRIN